MTTSFEFPFENGTFGEYSLVANESDVSPTTAPPQMRLVFNVVVIGCMVLIMFAMGCEVTLPELVKHMRRPTGIAIGLLSQFLVLPLVGFTTIKMLSIGGLHAASILILSCSPGGGYSNLLTYLSKGDVPLSVAMTTISNLLALGMTPLNMWVYSHGLTNQQILIPFLNMFISMVVLTAVLAGGMLLRWKLPKVAPYIVKAGVGSSGLLAVACGVLAIFLYRDFFVIIPGSLYLAVSIVAPVGLASAYCAAWALREEASIRRTVAIEAAVQNIGTAITIFIISFPQKDLKVLSQYVILYAGATVLGLLLAAGVTALFRRICPKIPKESSDPQIYKPDLEKPMYHQQSL